MMKADTYSPMKGLFYLCLGRLLIAISIAIWIATFYQDDPDKDASIKTYLLSLDLLDIILIVGIASIGVKISRRGKKLRILPGELLLKRDTRAPILYLRGQDAAEYSTAAESSLSALGLILESSTDEEDLSNVFSKTGPFLTVVTPAERDLGVNVPYLCVENSAWQNVVTDLSRRAKLVILKAGTTPCFALEIENIVKNCSPEKVLFYFPESFSALKPGSASLYDEFQRLANFKLPHPLPQSLRNGRFIFFRPGWIPECVQRKTHLTGISGSQANNIRKELFSIADYLQINLGMQASAASSLLRIVFGVIILIPTLFIIGILATSKDKDEDYASDYSYHPSPESQAILRDIEEAGARVDGKCSSVCCTVFADDNSTNKYISGSGIASTKEQAQEMALNDCRQQGGTKCKVSTDFGCRSYTNETTQK